jgi:hypothetical protein
VKQQAIVLSVVVAVAGFASGAFAAGRTVVGYVSDSECATKSAKASSAAEWIKPAVFEDCVKKCLKDGSTAVFVTEDNKVLHFDAASVEKIKAFHGHKVSVTGTVQGETLSIERVSDLKLQ